MEKLPEGLEQYAFEEALAYNGSSGLPQATLRSVNMLELAGYQTEAGIPKNEMEKFENEAWDYLENLYKKFPLASYMPTEENARSLVAEFIEEKYNLAERMGLKRGETRELIESVEDFTSSGFRDIRAASAGLAHWKNGGGQEYTFSYYKKKADNIDKFIENSPKYKGDTYRGMTLSTSELNAYKAAKGKTIGMQGLSSWTRSEKVATDFLYANAQGKTHPVVFVCKGKQKHGTSVSQYAPRGNESQKEVLCSSKAKWKITDIAETERKVQRSRNGAYKKEKVTTIYVESV